MLKLRYLFYFIICVFLAPTDPTYSCQQQRYLEWRKSNCPPHPFQGVIGISNGKQYTRNKKRKDLPTEQLSSLDFTKEIETYLTSLSRADCCVSVQGEPRKCKCFSFLADKLSIIKVVACGLKKYFDLDDSTRKFVLASVIVTY